MLQKKCKTLAPEDKSRYVELATVGEENELTEKQVFNKISSIFTKLNNNTVSILLQSISDIYCLYNCNELRQLFCEP